MKRLLSIGIVSLAAAMVLFVAFHHTRAQGESSAAWGPTHLSATQKSDPLPKNLNHELFRTYFVHVPGTTEPAGPSALDSGTTFKCWLPCTLEVEQNVQVGNNTKTGNTWGLGVMLDGSLVATPFVGEAPTDTSYVIGTYVYTTSLDPGTHTVQSWIDTDDGLVLGFNNLTYRIYVP